MALTLFVEFIESVDMKPLAAELRGQASNAGISEHALRLLDERVGILQLAGGGSGAE